MKVDPPRRHRARASRRRQRPRRRPRDRAEARRAGRARQGRRGAAGPAAAARRRRHAADPDDARHAGSRRARRPAPLGRAPARRGRAPALPGRQGGDRAADRERLLLRLRVPGADQRRRPRGDRGRGAARARRGPHRGSARRSPPTRPARGSRPRASRTRSSSSTPPRAPISLYTQGDFTDLCRGPAPPELGADQGLQAHVARRRLLARRLEQHAADADLRDRVLHPEGPRREPRAARGGEGARPPAARARSSTSSTSTSTRRGRRSGIPKGMAIFNTLEDLRRRENARRGYSEVKTPLIYDKALWVTSGHWEKFRENMFLIPIDDEHTYAVKPMNCPGHMLLFGSQLRSYRDLPLRYAEAAPLHRNELAGALHGLTRVRYVTQDDAHIFCSQEQVDAELDGCSRVPPLPLRPLRDRAARRALDAARQQARHRRGVGLHRGQARRGARAARDRVLRRRGGGLVLRAEDRPPHHRRAASARGSSARSSSTRRCRPASGSPTWAPDNQEHPVFVVHRAFLGSFERFIGILIEHYARRVPALARAGAGARAAGQRAAPRGAPAGSPERIARGGLPRRGRRARRDARQADPRQPSSRRSRTSSSGASASPTRRSPSARAPTGQTTKSLAELLGGARRARAPSRSRRCSLGLCTTAAAALLRFAPAK